MSSFVSDFGDMLPHTVFVSRKIGTDSYNKAIYTTSTSHQARVVFGRKLVRNSKGELVMASGSLWMFSRLPMKVEDKYEFLSEAEPSPPGFTQLFPIIIDTFPDESGTYHNKVYFQ